MNGEAQTLLQSDMLAKIFADIERTQFEVALYAKTEEIRRDALGEVRCIRSVLSKLRSAANNRQADTGV